MTDDLRAVLNKVQKPARYVGGEYNQIIKDKKDIDVRVAFCFPDTYEIGMSNLGMSILYKTMNSLPYVWCERVFAPWGDMYREMKERHLPLYGLESGDPLGDFDVIAFSVGYEMAYTTVLDMLDMSGIPYRREERNGLKNLVVAGGTISLNPAPMADFIDVFFVGEGEELDNEFLALYKEAKDNSLGKYEFLKKASQIRGVYIPALYDIEYNEDMTIKRFLPKEAAPFPVRKRVIEDLNSVPFPTDPIVPNTEVIHDRISLELFRGCFRGCRFCQAGFTYRPIRMKGSETLRRQGIEAVNSTGHNEITLLSLSTSDYCELENLCDGLLKFCEERSVGLSLPSLRVDNFSIDLMEKVQKVRKSGLTFAVEGGSQRLRDAINKNVTEEEVMNSCRIAFEGGWNTIKLYYMLGLPTETDEDIRGIAEMSDKVQYTWRTYTRNRKRGLKVTVSTSCFIPKPHTPFQWEKQVGMEEYLRKVNILRDSIKAKSVTYNWHDAETSVVEGILSRGDFRIGNVIESVFKKGGRLEAWFEYFDLNRWLEALDENGLSLDFYLFRDREYDEVLPWDIIDVGVLKGFLINENKKAHRNELTGDCGERCLGCGAFTLTEGGYCYGKEKAALSKDR